MGSSAAGGSPALNAVIRIRTTKTMAATPPQRTMRSVMEHLPCGELCPRPLPRVVGLGSDLAVRGECRCRDEHGTTRIVMSDGGESAASRRRRRAPIAPPRTADRSPVGHYFLLGAWRTWGGLERGHGDGDEIDRPRYRSCT